MSRHSVRESYSTNLLPDDEYSGTMGYGLSLKNMFLNSRLDYSLCVSGSLEGRKVIFEQVQELRVYYLSGISRCDSRASKVTGSM